MEIKKVEEAAANTNIMVWFQAQKNKTNIARLFCQQTKIPISTSAVLRWCTGLGEPRYDEHRALLSEMSGIPTDELFRLVEQSK